MKNFIKKTAAALACGALICSAASCGNAPTALTVNGQDVRAGIYIYYQMQAVDDATLKLQAEQPDLDQNAEDFNLLSYNIEGTPARDWIANRTVELCKEYVAISDIFDSYGFSLDSEEVSSISTNVNSLWTDENMYAQYYYGVDIIGQYYESLGIGKQSFKEAYTADRKKRLMFDMLYNKGGKTETNPDEVYALINENYILVKYFTVDPAYGTAQEYADMLNGGKTFAEVKQAYELKKQVTDAEKEMAEAKENGEEYTGTLPEEITVDLEDDDTYFNTINKASTNPSEQFVKEAFEMKSGEKKVISVKNTTTNSDGTEVSTTRDYVVSRYDISENEYFMNSCYDSELHNYKDDEYDKLIADKAAGYSVTTNSGAINQYKVEKVIR